MDLLRTYSQNYLWWDRQEVRIGRHLGRHRFTHVRRGILDDNRHCEGGGQRSSQRCIFKPTGLIAESDAQHPMPELVRPNQTLTGSLNAAAVPSSCPMTVLRGSQLVEWPYLAVVKVLCSIVTRCAPGLICVVVEARFL